MMWTVQHCPPVRARFAFNCYKHWVQILLLQTLLLIQEGVTQLDTLLVVLNGIYFVTLAEEFRAADPGLLAPLYEDDEEFDGSGWRILQPLKLLIESRPN